MTSAQNLEAAIAELKGNFGGELLRAGDPGYDAARKVHNGLIDKHPSVIARCTGTADIVYAVKFGRQNALEIAVDAGRRPWLVDGQVWLDCRQSHLG